MNNKHTKGPWETSGLNISTSRNGTYYLVQNGLDSDSAGMNELRANARLIAAAPELLDAVIAAHAYLCDKDPRADARHEIKDLIKSAIAKTKGEV